MNKLFFIICNLFFLFPIHAETARMVDVYYVLPNVTKEELRDMNLASSYIAETFKKSYFTGVNLIYSQDEDKYIQAYTKGDQRMLGLHLLTIAKNYTALEPITKYYFIHSLNKDLFEEYIILAKDISTEKEIYGLKGAIDGSQNSEIFSDMTCLSLFKKEYKKALSVIKAKNAQDAIFKLYFDQADVAFVPLRSWESALKLNPSLGKTIKIILKSPKVFTYGVLSIRNNVNEENVEMLKQVSNDMVYKPEGQRLKLISKVKSTKLIFSSEIKSVIGYYLTYLDYKRRLCN